MTWERLYKRAYELAIRCNQEIIIYDLPSYSEAQLSGVIYYLLRLQEM